MCIPKVVFRWCLGWVGTDEGRHSHVILGPDAEEQASLQHPRTRPLKSRKSIFQAHIEERVEFGG